jgi:DNA polymerase elongation subunit (family B)
MTWMRAKRCSPYLELFLQLDDSKRAEKTLQLVIHKLRSKELKIFELATSRTLQTWIETKSTLG